MEKNDVFWGTALWIFFHVIVNKIKPETFHIIRSELLQIIYSICNNISCNICQKHSIEYLQNNNFMKIKTANELKTFFFIFHNSINFKKNKELFLYDNLNKYNNYKISLVLHNISQYNYIFIENKQVEFIDEINKWFNTNMNYFQNT